MAFLGLAISVSAQVIVWQSDSTWPQSLGSKLYHDDSLLDNRMKFELGVFVGSFIPDSTNRAQWAANWKAAPDQRVTFDPVTGVFTRSFQVTSNASPFQAGKRAYIWGFTGDYQNGEWLLVSHPSWNWPDANDFLPEPHVWNISHGNAVDQTGDVYPSGTPCVFRTASIPLSPPPHTSWAQWQAEKLAGEPLNAPSHDPDHDGSTNLEEYAHATDPRSAASVARVTPQWFDVSGQRHFGIHVPRRPDRSLNVETGTSSDLANWNWSGSQTVIVAQDIDGWRIRCSTPAATAAVRFLRVRYSGVP